MDKILKIFALEYIKEQDNLTKDDKLQLAYFVRDSNDSQVESLLLGGTMLSEEEANKFLGEAIDPSMLGNLIRGGPDLASQAASLGQAAILQSAAVVAAGIIAAGFIVYRNYFSKIGKKCRDYQGVPKKLCLATVRGSATSKHIQKLQASKKLCSKSKDPAKCSNKVDQKIEKLKSKLNNYESERKRLKSIVGMKMKG